LNNITISRYCCVYWRTFIIIYWYNTTGWIVLKTVPWLAIMIVSPDPPVTK